MYELRRLNSSSWFAKKFVSKGVKFIIGIVELTPVNFLIWIELPWKENSHKMEVIEEMLKEWNGQYNDRGLEGIL